MRIKIFVILLTILIFTNCSKNDKQLDDCEYSEKYISLIEEYQLAIDDAELVYKKHLSIPSFNKILKYKERYIKKFLFKDSILLSPVKLTSPETWDYTSLGYVRKDGIMFFSGVNGSDGFKYDYIKDLLTQDESIVKLYFSQKKKRIFISDQWYDVEFNRKNREYYVEGQNFSIQKEMDFPKYFNSSIIISPIFSKSLVCIADYPLKLKHHVFISDTMFLLYDWKKKKILRDLILPATDKYKLMNTYLGVMDANQLIYLHVPLGFHQNYPGMIHGHIMIYDILNDTMYNIRHPLMQATGEDEELLETNYILGEDENIYYQLVTDKAYYIYKIEPLWDEPMEETDYNPVFFEFYPELKAEWDNLQEQSE